MSLRREEQATFRASGCEETCLPSQRQPGVSEQRAGMETQDQRLSPGGEAGPPVCSRHGRTGRSMRGLQIKNCRFYKQLGTGERF